jgi:omega-6 fatty acid desaturase (delta-12 desaturase)
MSEEQTSGLKSDDRWVKIIAPYRNGDYLHSWWQVINTFVPYVLLWVLMVISLKYSYWITLPLILLSAGFLVRLFIIFHDCGHGSFFKSKRLSEIVGYIFGVLAFTPYHRWHYSHLIHHQTVGNLDKRGLGDVWTLTVDEYLALPQKKQLAYRIFRNPLIMFGLGAALLFLVNNRFTRKDFSRKQKMSVYATNAGIAVLATTLCLTIGWKAYLLIQIPVMYFASIGGVFLFYLQHQFDGVHWYSDKEWDFKTVALHGSSYYQLPAILQWFSGNIGFHHVHHLSSKIPNYRLEKCHNENELFRSIKPIPFLQGFKYVHLKLWDTQAGKLIRFKDLKMKPVTA